MAHYWSPAMDLALKVAWTIHSDPYVLVSLYPGCRYVVQIPDPAQSGSSALFVQDPLLLSKPCMHPLGFSLANLLFGHVFSLSASPSCFGIATCSRVLQYHTEDVHYRQPRSSSRMVTRDAYQRYLLSLLKRRQSSARSAENTPLLRVQDRASVSSLHTLASPKSTTRWHSKHISSTLWSMAQKSGCYATLLSTTCGTSQLSF